MKDDIQVISEHDNFVRVYGIESVTTESEDVGGYTTVTLDGKHKDIKIKGDK